MGAWFRSSGVHHVELLSYDSWCIGFPAPAELMFVADPPTYNLAIVFLVRFCHAVPLWCCCSLRDRSSICRQSCCSLSCAAAASPRRTLRRCAAALQASVSQRLTIGLSQGFSTVGLIAQLSSLIIMFGWPLVAAKVSVLARPRVPFVAH